MTYKQFYVLIFLQADPVYYESKTEAEEDQEYIAELLSLVQDNKFTLDDVRKIQAKLKLRHSNEDRNQEHSLVQKTVIVNNEIGDNDHSDALDEHPTTRNTIKHSVSKPTPSYHTITSRFSSYMSSPTNQRDDRFQPNADNVTPIITEDEFLSTPQRQNRSVTSEQATSARTLSKRSVKTPLREASMTPMASAKENTPTLTKHSLKMNTPQNSIDSTDILRSHIQPRDQLQLDNSSRKSNQDVDMEFNLQLKQQDLVSKSCEISEPHLPIVPYSYSQSSYIHSTGGLSQHSHKTDQTNSSEDSNLFKSVPHSSDFSTVQTSRNLDLVKRKNIQYNRIPEEIRSEICSPNEIIKPTEAQFFSTPQRQKESVTCEQATPVSKLNQHSIKTPLKEVLIPPMSSAKQNTANLTKHSLKTFAIRNSHESSILHTPQRDKLVLANSSRKSNQYVDKEFNLQLKQQALISKSPEIFDPNLSLVPYSFSQSSRMPSTGGLNQHSYNTDQTSNSGTSNYYISPPLSPVSTTSRKHFDSAKRIKLQHNRITKERSSEISSPNLFRENNEVWSDSSKEILNCMPHDNDNQYCNYSPFLTTPKSTPARCSQSRQMWSGSHTSMVLPLSPDLERISTTIDNRHRNNDYF